MRITPAFLLIVSMLAAQSGLKNVRRIDDHVYRGRQPSDEEFAMLAQMGVKTVIDLRGGLFHKPREKKLARKTGLRYVQERFSGIFAPHDSQIAKILAAMEDPFNAPVFIHCKRGADRVGVVIACYRMAHDGWTNDQALQEASDGHISPLEILMLRYIRHFDAARIRDRHHKHNAAATVAEIASPAGRSAD
jgi:tyrosine-protein phosphatase SIW14